MNRREEIFNLIPDGLETYIKEHAGFSGWEQYKQDKETLSVIALDLGFTKEQEKELVTSYIERLIEKADLSEHRREGFMSLVHRSN